MLNHSINNILHCLLNKRITAYYAGNNNSLFLEYLLKNDQLNVKKQPVGPFDCIIHDDPVQYSQIISQLSEKYHVNSIILFHNIAPQALKKEDKHILYNKIRSQYKIFFNHGVQKSWGFPLDDKTHILSYGIDRVEPTIKNKQTIIVNITKNPEINRLYQYLKQSINCDLLEEISTDYKKTLELLSEYKIIIVINDPFTTILCASFGGHVFSSTPIIDTNIHNITIIDDFGAIQQEIMKILNNNTSTKLKDTYFQTNFDINQFDVKFLNILHTARQRPYIYET